jgi:phage terminase large subunit-like protein
VDGGKRGLVWRPDCASYAIEFFRYLHHSKGEWAGRPFVLSPWQAFCVGSVFGWLRKKDGLRRFRVVYEEIPRKNGKSSKLAGVGVYGLVADREPGAEIYAAATKKDQARIIFGEAQRMVRSSPELRGRVGIYKLNLSVDNTASKFEPLSSDERTLDGLNPSMVLVDELHKHRNRALFDVMDTALGARRQPLMWIITTAGDDDPETVYASENDYAIKVLEGVVEDDTYFCYIATIDTQPHDEKLTGIRALRHLDQTCDCGRVPPTRIEQFFAEACANHATGFGGKKTRRAPAPSIPTVPPTQRASARPATIDPVSTPNPADEAGTTQSLPNGAEETRNGGERSRPGTEQSRRPDSAPATREYWQSTASAPPNTTSDMPSNKDAAASASGRDLYAWITTTTQKRYGDSSAENATPGLVFSETLRSIYAAHSPTCAVRQTRLENDGLVVTTPADRWDDPAAWAKANPALGVSVKLDDLQRQAAKAAASPPAQAAFKRLRLNVRQSTTDKGIDMDVWAANSRGPFDPARLHGRRFFGGLDLASKVDLTAWVKLFPPTQEDDRWTVVCDFWIPGDTIVQKSDRDRVQYARWVDAGLVHATEGNIIDYGEVMAQVLEDCRLHEPSTIAYDPWNAPQLAQQLTAEGAPMIEFVQGVRSYNAATKELEALLLAHKIDHGSNPVLTWMAHNLRITTPDRNNNVMPSKKHSTGRIDGMSGLIMAIGRSMIDDDGAGLDAFLNRPITA